MAGPLAKSADMIAIEASVERINAACGKVVRKYSPVGGIEMEMGAVVCALLDRIEAQDKLIDALNRRTVGLVTF